MKNIILLLFVLFLSQPGFSQLFYASKSPEMIAVELNDSIAVVEVFYMYRAYHPRIYEEVPRVNGQDDILFANDNFIILWKKNNYIIQYRSLWGNKHRKRKLSKADKDYRYGWRRVNYSDFYLVSAMHRMQDSLLNPQTRIYYNYYDSLKRINDDSLPFEDYKAEIDLLRAHYAIKINKQVEPEVRFYYQKIDSLEHLDSNEITCLLENADYEYHYAKYLLYKLSSQHPNLLISYMESDSEKKKDALKALRRYHRCDKIHENVQAYDSASKGSKLIRKHKRIRDVDYVGGAVVYTAIIAAELVGIALVVVWAL